MRRRFVFALVVGGTIGAGFVACGLDEHGEATDGGVDATSNDSPNSDALPDVPIDVPQACKTLDASACVDAAVPDGWTLAVITAGDQLCPTTVDYDKTTFLTNLAPQSLCNCGCAVSGAVDCSGTLEAGSGNPTCNEGAHWFLVDAGNDAACFNTAWNDPHYAVPAPPTSTANVKCDASAPAPGWTASTETSCTPKCTADFCGVGSTYQRCILSGQNLPCPAPFTKSQPVFGIEAGVVTSCSGCACSVDAGRCSAIIQPFNNPNCDTANDDASTTNGTCLTSTTTGGGGKVNSFSYLPVVPQATCTAGGGTPSAQFASSVTVCCLP